MTEEKSEIEKIWDEYQQCRSKEVRDKLILYYAPLVKYVAGKIRSRLPSNIEIADLISYGILGLIDAIKKFDSKRNIKFENYAISRIKGAIIDELRALDWVPRSLRHKSKEIEKTYSKLEAGLKRMPTDEELANALSINVEDLHNLMFQLSCTYIAGLEDLYTIDINKEDKIPVIDTIVDEHAREPSIILETSELKESLTKAIEQLPDKEKVVVALYYYEGLTLKEVGEILGVTESRVSQLHTKAIFRLKTYLQRLKSQAILE